MFKVVIIDDESKACQLLKNMLLEFCPDVDEVRVANSGEKGLELIDDFHPDILFIDINMPKMDGFETLDNLEGFNGKIIFTTAYDDHAIKAFKYNAFDYLLKPIDIDVLEETIERLKKSEGGTKNRDNGDLKKLFETVIDHKDYPTSIAINDKGGLVFIKTSSIKLLKAQGGYTTVHAADKEYVVSKALKHFEDLLDPKQFIRVHKSYMVNMEFIERYSSKGGGELTLDCGYVVPVSRRKRSVLEKFSV